MKNKQKMASVALAAALTASSSVPTLAASSRNHTTYTNNGVSYYVDDNKNKVYTEYVIHPNGMTITKDNYTFDEKDNVIYYDNSLNIYVDSNGYSYYVTNNTQNYNYGYTPNYNYDYNSNYSEYGPNSNYAQNNGYIYSNGQYYQYPRTLEEAQNYISGHLNIEFNKLEDKRNFFKQHRQHCTDTICNYCYDKFLAKEYELDADYNNSLNYDYEYNYSYDNNYADMKFYTLVKNNNGHNVYAFSPVADVSVYGLYGWQLNSEYNANDYELNSVFYEERYTFSNYRIEDAVARVNNLYVWRYNLNGVTKYCLATVKDPSITYSEGFDMNVFEYNSKFNINDLGQLKTVQAAMYDIMTNSYTRTYVR